MYKKMTAPQFYKPKYKKDPIIDDIDPLKPMEE